MVVCDGGKCYVVFKGRKPEVYANWEEAEPHVSGFSGGLHRKSNKTPLMTPFEHFYTPGLSGTNAGMPIFVGEGSYARPFSHSVGGVFMHYLPLFPSAATTHHGASSRMSDQQNGNAEVGIALARIESAVSDPQGRLSQMECERWELLMKLGEICDNMSAIINHKEQL
ncbi:hypothetical protein PIB30_006851 [Stylosanthes scabra]|uniref:Ribonuclease H1 N-terminal domain-containing protein n=1 Tax=Stylosanthes scabra TaxID=79078 RepID=A0ABU6V2T0_9FABA|nr:hypothetical protein [Stylosanthes scabra]